MEEQSQILFTPLTWYAFRDKVICKGISNGKISRIEIPLGSTKVILYDTPLSSEEQKELFEAYDALKLGTSHINSNVIVARNPVIPPEESHDWVDIKTDPSGTIASLFQSLNIEPYKEFLVYPGTSKVIHEKQISSSIEKTKSKSQYKRLYWDIEVVTARKEFVYAKYVDNHIISISVVFVDGGAEEDIQSYFLYWGGYDIKNRDFISVRFSNEADLIKYFYSLVKDLNPDRMYTFNGDSFDIPYLIERSKLHSLSPSIGFFRSRRIKGRFTWETVQTWETTGIEQVDIIRVMLKFFSGLPNYKLETIGKLFLGEGKTGLDIEEMFKSFYIQDPRGMELLAKYSVQDSALLHKLNQMLAFDSLLENICNSGGIIISELLNLYDSDIISRLAYKIDPGSVYMSGDDTPGIVYNSSLKMGKIYRDVYIYDYSNYYIAEMSQYSDDFTFMLTERAAELPSHFKSLAYSSKYFARSPELDVVKGFLKGINNLLEVTPTLIKTVGPVGPIGPIPEDDNLILREVYTHLLPLGKISMAARKDDGTIITIGTAKILKSKFKLGQMFLISCLKYIFGDLTVKPEIPDFDEVEPTDLLISSKIKNKNEYPAGSINYILAEQSGEDIQTWATLKYYMTDEGPILRELITPDDVIDNEYYIKELEAISKVLKYK